MRHLNWWTQERSMRKIIHIDQDCFYAAVAIKDNPSLRGKPVAVGGNSDRRGVITTCSYEARKFGVRSAMSTRRALQLCPKLILVPPQFERYKEESRKIRSIFQKFTDKIEPLSLDEAYLDVTECLQFNGSATHIASAIRSQILLETQLTASAGVAPNKFLAKVASDWNKPNGQFTIAPSQIEEFVRTLKIEKIPGVGKITTRKMNALGLMTCGDLQKLERHELLRQFGKWGDRLYDYSRGLDERPVAVRSERKSVSVERTYGSDLQTLEQCLLEIPSLFQQFLERLQKVPYQEKCEGLFVKVKFYDFKQTTLDRAELKSPSIVHYKELLQQAFERRSEPVRLIGIGMRLRSESKPKKQNQLSFF